MQSAWQFFNAFFAYNPKEMNPMNTSSYPSKVPFTLAFVALGVLAACGGNEPPATNQPIANTSVLTSSDVMPDTVPEEAVSAMPSDAVLKDEPAQQVEQAAAAPAGPLVEVNKFSTWSTGYCARVNVTNTASTPLVWKVSVPVAGKVTRAWKATWTFAAGRIMAQGLEYNRELAAGTSTDFGFCTDTQGAAPAPAPSSYGNLVLNESFNNRNSDSWERYTLAMANADFNGFGSRNVRGFDGDDIRWRADNRTSDGVLRANFPANIAGGYNSGFIFDKFFPSGEEATLEYRVRFDGSGPGDDFEWAYGGKLPGLGGTSQSQSPTGCTQNDSTIKNGFSARLMWHRRGDLVIYTYLPDRDTDKCGVPTTFLQNAQPNRWYTVRQHIKLNTPGQRNGLMEMFVDGRLGLRQTNVLYRESGKGAVKINNVLFHTYRGGRETDERFHSSKNEYIEFDDFKVWVK
jgi:hypothetical protein